MRAAAAGAMIQSDPLLTCRSPPKMLLNHPTTMKLDDMTQRTIQMVGMVISRVVVEVCDCTGRFLLLALFWYRERNDNNFCMEKMIFFSLLRMIISCLTLTVRIAPLDNAFYFDYYVAIPSTAPYYNRLFRLRLIRHGTFGDF